jgi:hypothetical protein
MKGLFTAFMSLPRTDIPLQKQSIGAIPKQGAGSFSFDSVSSIRSCVL